MTAADILDALLKANLASGAAILGVVALRKAARARFGARLAYGLWLLPVLAGAAVLLPARQVVVMRTAAPMLHAAFEIGRGLGPEPTVAAPTALDAPMLLVDLWLAGVAGALLVMAVLQHQFIARARRGGVGPAVVGLIAPRIFIPRDFAERYSADEQALVLAHEQAHLARQDSRLNGLAAAIQCLNWFNPLVHLAARLMRVDQELACDETVVNRFPDARRAYAEVLMKAQMAVLPLPLGCYWPSRAQHPLVERVAMLKRPRVGPARWRTGAVVLGCLWAGAGVAAWASQPAQVRTVFRSAPVVGGRDDALPSETTADAVSSPLPAPTPDRSAVIALAKVEPPPQPIPLPHRTMQVDHVLIVNAQRIDRETILSILAIRPGDSVTAEKLNAADKALFDSGLFAEWRIQAPPLGGSGDLRVWVSENPLVGQMKFAGNANLKDDQLRAVMQERPGEVYTRAKLFNDQFNIARLYRRAGWPNAKVAFNVLGGPKNPIDLAFTIDEGAKGQGGEAPLGPFAVSAEQLIRDEAHHIIIFKGNVAAVLGGSRVVSDMLITSSSGPDEPGVPGAKQVTWEGHVFVDQDDDAVRADQAVYDVGSRTVTLSGHVAVDRGALVVKNDRLVIDVKD